jgi:hypothetical protein
VAQSAPLVTSSGERARRAERTTEEGPLWCRGRVPDWLPGILYRSPLFQVNRDSALFRLPTVGSFLVRPGEATVVDVADGATNDDVECLLRGPVGALRSSLAGEFALRGSAIDLRGRALVACGIASGTSSLVAALALRGHRVLADGVVVIGGRSLGVSTIPEGRDCKVTLWPDSVEALGLDAAKGVSVRPSLVSRSFSLGLPPNPAPVLLGALVALEVSVNPQASGAIAPQPMPVGRKMKVVLEAQWHPKLVLAFGNQLKHFQWLARLAQAPGFDLRYAPGPASLTLPSLIEQAEGFLR